MLVSHGIHMNHNFLCIVLRGWIWKSCHELNKIIIFNIILFCLIRLEEGGTTALGPALLIATTMAGQHPGSKVIICTDGKANVGVGRLDLEEEMDKEAMFYKGIGNEAVEKG